jgi:hypothetical protein
MYEYLEHIATEQIPRGSTWDTHCKLFEADFTHNSSIRYLGRLLYIPHFWRIIF